MAKAISSLLFYIPLCGADREKYEKHCQDMEQDLSEDPDNPRLVYYLAQSCRDAAKAGGNGAVARLEQAVCWFDKRASMGGWAEEAWMGAYQAARCRQSLGHDPAVVIDAYRRAAYMRPDRPETWYYLAAYLRGQQRYAEALEAARRAVVAASKPAEDRLFVDSSVYEWAAVMELGLCLHTAGDHLLALLAITAVREALPTEHRAFAEQVLGICMRAMQMTGK
jgi:tetratricopeptide (TPR) repeat protein